MERRKRMLTTACMLFSNAVRFRGQTCPNLAGLSPNTAARDCGAGGLVQSRQIQTAIVAAITTNVQLAESSGKRIPARPGTGPSRDSDENISQLQTLDRGFLTEHAVTLPPAPAALCR